MSAHAQRAEHAQHAEHERTRGIIMTLKEIAKEAGVSISTVSRVINGTNPKAAGHEVRERIWEIVRRTGYTPNSSARNLKLGATSARSTSRSISCLFARTPNDPHDPFFSTIAKNAEMEAYKHNYIMKLSFTSIDITNSETCRLISDNDVCGVIVLGRCDKATLKFLKTYFHYVVYTGLNEIEANFDQILCSGHSASLCAMNHLIGLGHRHIGYLGETSSENRYLGYKSALESHKLPFDKSYVSSIEFTSEGGYKGAKKLISQQPDLTAIFCGNDMTAIGAIRAVKDLGLRIPQDISIISIDDIDTAQYLSPMLTTVHIPTDEMGKYAAKTIIDRINGGHTSPVKICFPCHLAKRDSCGPA